MYYCKSRYYNPEWCRWLTPDSIEYLDPESINGLNLYCYCGNNPIMCFDENGNIAWWAVALIIVAVVTIAVTVYGAVTKTPIVLDASLSLNSGAGVGYKIGVSLVIDFENCTLDWYCHQGYTLGVVANTFAVTGSAGIVNNYNGIGSYAGPFNNFGGGYWLGVDHCFDPRYQHSETCCAYSITYGNNFGVYYGYDEFYHIGSYKW